LVEKGYRVSVAKNGADALDMIREKVPSIVISDIEMPVMDGYKMCHKIKHDEPSKHIPVILLTDLADPKELIKVIHAKADGYVTKPFNCEVLISRIESLLFRPRQVDDPGPSAGLEFSYDGESYFLASDSRQILSLLIATYENSLQQRKELMEAQRDLLTVNNELGGKLIELQDSEHKFSTLVQMIPDIVYRTDTQGRFTFVSDAVSRIGYKAEELIGRHFSEIILPADIESVRSDSLLAKYRGKKTGPESAPKLFDERRTGERATRNLEVRLVTKSAKDSNKADSESVSTDVISVEINASGLYEMVSDSGAKQLVGTLGVATQKDRDETFIGTVGAIRDVSDRKLAEAALSRCEERFGLLVQTAASVIILLSPEHLVMEWNSGAEELFGQTRNEALGKQFLSFFSVGEQRDAIAGSLKDLSYGRHVRDFETSLRISDGTCRTLLWNISASLDDCGKPSGIIAVGQDVTEWKKAEEERLNAKSEADVAIAAARVATETIDGMMDFVVLVSPGGNIIQFNQSVKSFFEWDNGAIGKPLLQCLIAEDSDELEKALEACSSEGSSINNMEITAITKDSRRVPMLLNAGMVTNEDGKPSRIIAVLRDITARKKLEDDLRHSEEWYRSLVEDSFDGIFVQKREKIMFANSRLYQMLGYSSGELAGMDHWMVYHSDYREMTRQMAIAQMQGEQSTCQREAKLQRKDGVSFFAELSARPVKVDGEPGSQVWIRDVSQRKRSERALRRLAIAVEQAAEAIIITDIKGNIHYANPAFEQITGYSRKECIGKNQRILSSGEHDELFFNQMWETLKAGKVWTGNLVNRRKDGSLYEEEATISPIKDESGNIVNFVSVRRDVTKEVMLQKQLVWSQKMEAVGILAGGIAHDFNNLLQVILGYSQIILQREELGEKAKADIQRIASAGRNGAELVQRLLAFSRKAETHLRPVDVNPHAEQLKNILERTIPKMIQIKLLLGKNIATIKADPSQLDQILMNLALNASDAMPDGGTLTIETENVFLDNSYCQTHAGVLPGRYVSLGVSDNGFGMDNTTREHIFEPFFTTKETGKGTGLGLAMVYGIVKQHGGYITCESEPGQGTQFKIYFPAVDTPETVPATKPEEVIPNGGTETILLVDDEAVLRDMGGEILGQAGYTVLNASNGAQALEIYMKERQRISLVILDLVMPGISGKRCLEELLKIDPTVKVIVASGLSVDSHSKTFIREGARRFVSKPYDVTHLLKTVRDVLDAN
jgi:PAS domain S-box-containing protein